MTYVLVLWVFQAVILGTILSAFESMYSRFKFHWWAFMFGAFWPLLCIIECAIEGITLFKKSFFK